MPSEGLELRAAPERAAGAPTVTSGRWLGPPDRPLVGWLTAPAGATAESGVLMVGPAGYEHWSAYRTLRVTAERLAAAGHLVLRFDLDGAGDSAGEQTAPDRVAAWRASVRAAARELRDLGCSRLTVVGVRFGALLALIEGAEVGADTVVVWAPVASGRRYARELRLLAVDAPHDGDAVAAGVTFGAQTLADIAALEPAAIPAAPAPCVVVVDDPQASPATRLTDRLAELGCDVERREAAGGERALETPAEYATVPEEVVETICAATGPGAPAPGAPAPGRAAARFEARGAPLCEEIVELGPQRLVGVLSRPADGGASTSRTAVVFLNTGSEPHIGPGRAWVELARALAASGHPALRVDFRGWGESPDDGHAPGRPYDAHCVDDTVAIVRALRERGFERVALAGLCAGAWVALRAALQEPVDAVLALNPQLYWRPGDPVEATMAETRARRAPERRREERGRACGLWSALDVLGHRPWAAGWLDDLRRARVPVLMLFAEGDDGLEYLRNRVDRRLRRALRAGTLEIAEIPEIDHSMHRAWLRDRVAEALLDRLRRLDAERAAAGGTA